jgi:dynein light chain 1
MAKDMTTCKQAIANWAAMQAIENKAHEEAKRDDEILDPNPATATKVKLFAQYPPIKKMDQSLNQLIPNCEHLSLSTNSISQIGPLTLRNLKVLSLSRNNLKRIERLDEVGHTLEELWLSYNSIEKLTGCTKLKKLRVLFLANNVIRSFDELSQLGACDELQELLLLGNPIYKSYDEKTRRIEVLRRLPRLRKLDGRVVTPEERELAAGGDGAAFD